MNFFQTHQLGLLIEFLDFTKLKEPSFIARYQRVCRYLTATAPHFPEPEDKEIYTIVYQVSYLFLFLILFLLFILLFQIFRKAKQYCDSLRYALKLNNKELVKQTFSEAPNPLVRKQLAFILARHCPTCDGVIPDEEMESHDEPLFQQATDDEKEELKTITSNTKLSQLFSGIASSMNISDPKDPADVFKIDSIH